MQKLFFPLLVLLAATFAQALPQTTYRITREHVAGRLLERATPFVDGIPVEGADQVTRVSEQSTQPQFQGKRIRTQGRFVLSRPQAYWAAQQTWHMGNVHPSVLSEGHHADKVWLSTREGVRAAYRVRLSTLLVEDLMDTWIDAENGRVLKVQPAAHFVEVPARVFQFSPPPSGANASALVDATFFGLPSSDIGTPLRGDRVWVSNCCRAYTCPGGASSCDPTVQACAQLGDPGAIVSQKTFALSKALFNLSDADVPDLIYIQTPVCARLPLAAAGAQGFVHEPIEGTGAEAEQEPFSEQQIYHLLQHAFEQYGKDIQSAQSCLRGMNCDASGRAQSPFQVFTNQLLPDFKTGKEDENNSGSLANQLANGRGSSGNPVVLTDLKRVGNAAFVTGANRSEAAPTDGLDEVVGELVRPNGFFVIFQGKRDFAYDGDVVFHEFTHAAIDAQNSSLATFTADKWGFSVEPGAINEGYADYFAASLSDSTHIGEYSASSAEEPNQYLRTVENAERCPENIRGEIHDDSGMWSGALWEIQKAVVAAHGADSVSPFRGALYAAVAQAGEADGFTEHAARIVDELNDHPTFRSGIAQKAQAVFASRGIVGCERVHELSAPKAELSLLSPRYFGLENYAPAPLQFKITTRGAQSFELAWRQFFARTTFVGAPTPSDIEPIRVLVSDRGPIEWDYSNREAIPTQDGQTLDFDPSKTENKAVYGDERWRFTHDAGNSDPCASKTFYVSLLTLDNDYRLREITPTINTLAGGSDNCPAITTGGCACDANQRNSDAGPLFLLLSLLFAFTMRRAVRPKVAPLLK